MSAEPFTDAELAELRAINDAVDQRIISKDYLRLIATIDRERERAEQAEASCAVLRAALVALRDEAIIDCKDDHDAFNAPCPKSLMTRALASEAGDALLKELEALRELARLGEAWVSAVEGEVRPDIARRDFMRQLDKLRGKP